MKWLVGLSGVDRRLLAQSPGERPKYVGVGGAILMTSVMAGVSATYALYVSMKPPIVIALLLGILWALGILNLDRWIVTSTKRQGRFLKDTAMILPRLFLAVIIGAVISEPLVLRVFEHEIDAELQVMQNEQLASFEANWLNDPRYVELTSEKSRVQKLQGELDAGIPADAVLRDPTVAALSVQLTRVDNQLAEAERRVACEGVGSCGSGTAGAGPVFKQDLASRDRLLAQEHALNAELSSARIEARARAAATFNASRDSKDAELSQLKERVAIAERERAQDVALNTRRVRDSDGLLARIEALNRLSTDHPAMSEARKALFLFILAIECMPALVKLFMNLAKPGLYEHLQNAEEEAEKARHHLRIRTEAEEGHMTAQVALDAAEHKARAELDAHVAVSKALLDAQVGLGRAAAAKWKVDKLELLNHSPETFFGGSPTVPVQHL